MIARCQFCSQSIVGADHLDDSRAYRQLSLLVSTHMTLEHFGEAGAEVLTTANLAGAAVAMRYVDSLDPKVHGWRVKVGEALMQTFNPAPEAPLPALKEL
jgi:hypothetical protein